MWGKISETVFVFVFPNTFGIFLNETYDISRLLKRRVKLTRKKEEKMRRENSLEHNYPKTSGLLLDQWLPELLAGLYWVTDI